MKRDDHDSMAAKLDDDAALDAALHAAAEDARQTHIRAGLSAVGSRNGRIVHVDPVTLKELDETKRDSAI
jgi:hypothetical protein